MGLSCLCCIRFKSAKTRGGFVEDILIRDTRMENVPLPFTFTLNWNPSYSYATIPKDEKKPAGGGYEDMY